MGNGTPKTLHGAILNSLTGDDPSKRCLHEHIVDFLAQRFGVAMLEAQTPETEQALKKLFLAITVQE